MEQGHLDVCVVGGGPAGSVTALRLAQLGHRVGIVERASFPRSRVGESLTSGVWILFDVLGMRESFFKRGLHPLRRRESGHCYGVSRDRRFLSTLSSIDSRKCLCFFTSTRIFFVPDL
jgi:2-polyprenyl-6-methoxyphenol hydroxylase-like FAD-dependent oxidoreductase